MRRPVLLLSAVALLSMTVSGCAGPSTDSRFPSTNQASASGAPADPTGPASVEGDLRTAVAASIAQTERTGLVDAQSVDGVPTVTYVYAPSLTPDSAMAVTAGSDPMPVLPAILAATSTNGGRFVLDRLAAEVAHLTSGVTSVATGFTFSSTMMAGTTVHVTVNVGKVTGVSFDAASTTKDTLSYAVSDRQLKEIATAFTQFGPTPATTK